MYTRTLWHVIMWHVIIHLFYVYLVEHWWEDTNRTGQLIGEISLFSLSWATCWGWTRFRTQNAKIIGHRRAFTCLYCKFTGWGCVLRGWDAEQARRPAGGGAGASQAVEGSGVWRDGRCFGPRLSSRWVRQRERLLSTEQNHKLHKVSKQQSRQERGRV